MPTDTPLLRPVGHLLARGVGLFVSTARAVAFWSSVAFPLVYAGGYLAVALDPKLGLPPTELIVVLFVANGLALVVGHRHRTPVGQGVASEPPDGHHRQVGGSRQTGSSQYAD
ncbi:MAG: hypothetical protein V5A43_10725 [Haloarculaceae archaeon]